MIQELVNYSKWLKKDFPDLFQGKLEVGLHVLMRIGDEEISEIKMYKIGKNSSQIMDENQFVFDFAEQVSKSNVISANKCIHNDKYILSNNPFCYKLNLVTGTEITRDFDYDDIKKNGKIRKKKLLNHIKAIKKDYLTAYDDGTRSAAQKVIRIFIGIAFEVIKSINTNNNGNVVLQSDNRFAQQILEKIKESYLKEEDLATSQDFFKKLKGKKLIVYFDVDKKLYDMASGVYFQKKGGLKQSIPTIEFQNTQYTLNSFINNANEKKIFLKHLTAFNKYNYYHKKEFDELLEDFKPVIKELPNPLPIFILKSELNEKFITIFKNDKNKGYKEIISELFRTHRDDLQNYYLFNGNRMAINDFDYVTSFDYNLDRVVGKDDYFEIFNNNGFGLKIENIFDLEKTISKKFLFKVQRKNKAQFELLSNNYFTEKLSSGKGNKIPDFIENNIYKYRRTLYDVFYKARLHLITAKIFKDICIPVIRYEISHDEANNRGYSKNENRIIEKLLIYIQLNQIFDKNNINFGGVDMGSKLPEFYKQVRKLIQNDKKIDDDLQINSSELWAFAAGQLIYYLLSQSKSSNKSHAMFEPFLRRFNDANAFKNEILNTYKKYKHEISLNNSRFNQLASKVLEYSINNEDLTKYEAVVYSGYFAKSLLYESQNEN
ncbi:MAG: hypothetical protein PF690_15780 [Deltaproteobacteria bacterium]|jgi:hypothetical protein|nr:hypothetical protein [Deltaproteobacteria bacterium]